MDELIARIAAETGLDADAARQAVGIVLAFLLKEAPPAEMASLFAAMPGAHDLAAAHAAESGGGLMVLAGQLGAAGLSMEQMQGLGRELFAYGAKQAGEDTMGAIIGAVPGLGQFV